MTENTSSHRKTLTLVLIPLFSVLIFICSQISIPFVIPFTLQTLGIFATLGILGGKAGTVSILLYILLGMIGLPVFTNFNSGLSALLGPTGGYIIGFLFSGLTYLGITSIIKSKKIGPILGMVMGLLTCYVFGTLWFTLLYSRQNGSIALLTVLSWCVFPFIIPDIIKIILALLLKKWFSRYLRDNCVQ